MNISSEDADALFRRGEFLRLIQLSGSFLPRDPKTATRQRLKLANALALAGDLATASEIARRYAEQPNEPSIR